MDQNGYFHQMTVGQYGNYKQRHGQKVGKRYKKRRQRQHCKRRMFSMKANKLLRKLEPKDSVQAWKRRINKSKQVVEEVGTKGQRAGLEKKESFPLGKLDSLF